MAQPQQLSEHATNGDITAKVLSTFKQLIAEGALIPGQKIPAERELSSMFGVSRGSLRPALKVLESMGVISQRVGDGTYLNADSARILGKSLDFLVAVDDISDNELYESRLIVEPELAALAAERATRADLRVLEEALNSMREGLSDTWLIVKQDLAFHNGIFRCAGNRVCERFFGVVQQALLHSMARTSQLNFPAEIVESHEKIYRAIFDRDPELARRRMIEHIEWARDTMLQKQRSPASSNPALKAQPFGTKPKSE